MKKAALILAAVAFLAACKQTVHDSGCVIRYQGPPYYTSALKTGQLDTVIALFNASGLSTANLNFTAYYSDSTKDSSGTPYFMQVVYASLNVNGLPVFYSSLGWYFRNGVLQPNSYGPQFAYPGNDTTTTWTLPALRSQFFQTYQAALYSNNYRNPRLARPGIYYRDSCLYAQLGYIDLAFVPNSGADFGKKLLKVWRLIPSSPNPVIRFYFTPPAPAVFVVDSTGYAWCPSPVYPGEPRPIDMLY